MPEPPTVGDYMTESPHTIGQEQTLAAAREKMREHRIRHLPTLHGGELVGVLSLRDVALVSGLPDIDADRFLVEDAMGIEPYVVARDTPLHEVAAHMRDHSIGSAIVVEGRRVIGVFTAVDALRALCDQLARP